jgi:hypothetical protein
MNWKGLLKVLVNVGMTFVGGYGVAVAAGQPPKVAIGAGIVAVVGNQTGLHQEQPGAMK